MSHYMTSLAMRQTGIKPAAKIVLYWLADHHNGETGQCNPSISRLAKCCEMSRRSVENQIAALEAAGLIVVVNRFREKGGKASNSYQLCLCESDAQNLRMGCAKSAHGVCAKSAHDRTLEDTNLGKEPSIARKPKPERFEDFWDQYPHRNGAKKGKAKARAKYERLIASGISEHEIISGAMRYAGDRQVVEGYAKDPTTWLNNEGWTDDIEPPQSPKHNHNGSGTGQRSSMVGAFAAVAERRSRGTSGGGGSLI